MLPLTHRCRQPKIEKSLNTEFEKLFYNISVYSNPD